MKTWGIICLLALSLPLWANQPPEELVELRKKITKTFDAPTGKTIAASNRYGKITVVTYSGSQVKYDIEIIAKASSQSKAQKELDRVSVIFEDTPGLVSATTEIEDKTAWFTWSWSGNAELEINYTTNGRWIVILVDGATRKSVGLFRWWWQCQLLLWSNPDLPLICNDPLIFCSGIIPSRRY